jgi:hypothetical protein
VSDVLKEDVVGNEPDILKQIEAELAHNRVWLEDARCYVTVYRDFIRRGLLSDTVVYETLFERTDLDGSDRSANLEALQEAALELPPSAAQPMLSKIQKLLSDIRDVKDFLDWLALEMEMYAEAYVPTEDRSDSHGIKNGLALGTQQSQEKELLKARALKATVFKEVAELQKELASAESVYNELLVAAPRTEEFRSIEFECKIGKFQRTVDQLDAEIDFKRSEWRQRFGISDRVSDSEFLDRLPPDLEEAINAMRTHNLKVLSMLQDLAARGRREPAFHKLIEEWNEKIFDAAWAADHALDTIYGNAAQAQTRRRSPLPSAISGQPESPSGIDSVIEKLSTIRDQGQAELKRWFAENGAESAPVLHHFLSRHCKTEIMSVEMIADRLKLKFGIQPASREKQPRRHLGHQQ